MKDVMYTRMALLGLLLTVIGLVVVGCAGDDDDGDDGNGGGGTTGQIDRMAVPAVNTALIASARKNDFNRGDPSTDVANFQTEMTANLTALRAAVNQIPGMPAQDGTVSVATVIGIVCPDVVTIDTTMAIQFPNGRRLTDDALDPVLQLALDRTFVTDGVADDNTFLVGFPYLAAANP
jgi:hypothetical protein